MSEQDNVQTVRRIYDAFTRGDVPTILDALADRFDWHHRGAPQVPYGKERHTKQEAAQFFSELNDTVDVLGFDVADYIAQGDKVVALGSFKARSKRSLKEFDEPWAMVWTFRDGKVVGYRCYEDTLLIASALQ